MRCDDKCRYSNKSRVDLIGTDGTAVEREVFNKFARDEHKERPNNEASSGIHNKAGLKDLARVQPDEWPGPYLACNPAACGCAARSLADFVQSAKPAGQPGRK